MAPHGCRATLAARRRGARACPAVTVAAVAGRLGGVPEIVWRIVGGVLVLVHVGLGVWALVGFAELAVTEVPLKRVSNPLFSPSMLILQWTLIAIAAVCFVAGYLTRHPHLPVAMACIYAAMAATCAYQTFFILTHPTRFRAMAIEYAEYALILAILFGTEAMRRRFAGGVAP